MSDIYDDRDDDTNLVRDLRKQLREAKQREEGLAKEVTELKSSVRARSVEDVLASKGADKRIAKYIPADVTDEAGVLAWLESDGDLFGYKPGDGDSAGGDSNPAGLSPEDAEAARKLQQASSGGAPTADRQKQQLEAIQNAQTREELDALVFGAQRAGN